MDVNCADCAGCCVDWRPVGPDSLDRERRGHRPPLDDAYNLVPLTRDEVRDFLRAGYGDVMTPRLWEAEPEDESVTVDGHDLVAIGGKPVFFVGLRKPPKPVGPFGLDRRWLDACVFLDPETLRCRIHGSELYPRTCADYPGQNLTLDRETECERVEAAYGGERLLDDTPPDDVGLALGPHALGTKLFAYPEPEELHGVVDRIAADATTGGDRARFVGVAVGTAPGSVAVDESRVEQARQEALDADSWAGQAAATWAELAGEVGSDATGAVGAAAHVEVGRGADEQGR